MKAWMTAVAMAGAMFAGVSGTVSAAIKADGNEFLTQCQHYIKAVESEKDFDRFQAGICSGMVQGVQSTVYFLSDDLKNDAKFCIPADVTNGQSVRIVIKYMKDNPKLLNENRTGLIWLALKDAYPCKG